MTRTRSYVMFDIFVKFSPLSIYRYISFYQVDVFGVVFGGCIPRFADISTAIKERENIDRI